MSPIVCHTVVNFKLYELYYHLELYELQMDEN